MDVYARRKDNKPVKRSSPINSEKNKPVYLLKKSISNPSKNFIYSTKL